MNTATLAPAAFDNFGRCLPLAKTGMCEFHPPVGSFAPRVKWEWQGSKILPSYNQIMMTPMVGDVDGDCMPDVVFSTFAGGNYNANRSHDGAGILFVIAQVPTIRVESEKVLRDDGCQLLSFGSIEGPAGDRVDIHENAERRLRLRSVHTECEAVGFDDCTDYSLCIKGRMASC